jgi:hypothetical protein
MESNLPLERHTAVEGMQVGSGEKCKDYYKSQIDWLRKYVVPEDK